MYRVFDVQQQIRQLILSYPDLFNDEEDWILTLGSETNLWTLFTQIVRQIDDAAALENGTKERLEQLKARKDRFVRRQEALRNLAFKMMELANLKKAELPEATLSIRNGSPSLVGECDAAELPDEFCKISREPDRTKIKDALKAGQTVPGFSLSNAAPSLSIRIK